MSAPAIALLAFSLSVDAMIAALGRGAALVRPSRWLAIRIGLLFAAMETALALAGWALGHRFGDDFAAVDHWLAFALLTLVGGRMMIGGGEAEEAPRSGLMALVAAALGSSIDAMAVGASLAFLDAPILPVALAIGTATFIMAAGGAMAAGSLGRRLGPRFADRAENLGGAALLGLGFWILVSHLVL